MMRKLFFAFAALMTSSSSVLASAICNVPSNEFDYPDLWAAQCANAVPELSPMAGAAALAAVLALVAFVWERRRAA